MTPALDLDADLAAAVAEVVEGWYVDQPLDREGLFDRVEAYGFDLPEQWDDPLAVAVLAYARRIRREALA